MRRRSTATIFLFRIRHAFHHHAGYFPFKAWICCSGALAWGFRWMCLQLHELSGFLRNSKLWKGKKWGVPLFWSLCQMPPAFVRFEMIRPLDRKTRYWEAYLCHLTCYRQKTAAGYSFKETFLVSSRGARSFGPLINCQASERCGHHYTMMIIQIRDGRTRVQWETCAWPFNFV